MARERGAGYQAGAGAVADAPPTLEEALERVDEAVAVLQAVELSAEPDEAVAQAAVALPGKLARLQARQVELLGEIDRRKCYQRDGAVTAASWYRARVGCDAGEAQALVVASRRLRALAKLDAAFADGKASWAHVKAITKAAVPQRMPAIQFFEDTLVQLACAARPQHVRVALKHIRDANDADGSEDDDEPEQTGPDPRRELTLRPTVDKLGDLEGVLDPLTAELLLSLLEAYITADPADTPEQRWRSAAQRRHDALHTMLEQLAGSEATPTVHGARPQVLAMADIATLAGADSQATRKPAFRHLGEVSGPLARRVARQARITAVQTMGPWRPVSVGRKQRVLPGWLRDVLQMLHRHCRGPDCDRPASWAQAHHLDAWTEHGETDLNRSIPLCQGHHDMVTTGGWTVDMDADTGMCTWTAPDGRVIHTYPPQP